MIRKKFTLSLLFVGIFGFFLVGKPVAQKPFITEEVVSKHVMSLDFRYPVAMVSEAMKKNILLNVRYLQGDIADSKHVNWDEIQKPFSFDILLTPQEVFAFHDTLSPKYRNKKLKSVHLEFVADEGFVSDGHLVGDGVCHLASLMYMAALDAGMFAEAPSNHNFMAIPEIPKEFGVSIFNYPSGLSSNGLHNLYITNNRDENIIMRIEFDGKDLGVSFVVRNSRKESV